MEKVFELVIEAGWGSKRSLSESPFRREDLLDPTFWQALGKALGWNKWEGFNKPYDMKDEWQDQWHRFITALSEGQSPDDFFKTLLSGTDLVS